MWKKAGLILLILMLGPLLSMEGSGEPVEEDDERKYSTRIKEVFFLDDEDYVCCIQMFDIYEEDTSDLLFTYQLLYRSENMTFPPIENVPLILRISMGSYRFEVENVTNSRGMTNFTVPKPLRDSATGNFFQLQSNQKESNITISVSFEGNENYNPTTRSRLGTYHRYEPEPPEPSYGILPGGLYLIFLIFTNSFAALIFIPLLAISLRRKKQDSENEHHSRSLSWSQAS